MLLVDVLKIFLLELLGYFGRFWKWEVNLHFGFELGLLFLGIKIFLHLLHTYPFNYVLLFQLHCIRIVK